MSLQAIGGAAGPNSRVRFRSRPSDQPRQGHAYKRGQVAKGRKKIIAGTNRTIDLIVDDFKDIEKAHDYFDEQIRFIKNYLGELADSVDWH